MEKIMESKMSAPELIVLHGYRSESHTVMTQDGYVLTIHRVLPVTDFSEKMENKLVLLHHGLLGSSDDWLLLGPVKALPYLLSDVGYDVWLANARGNKYSNAHTNLNTDYAEYWNFSWHEIGIFDLRSTLDYIKSITKAKIKIDFIGHSMGTSAVLALLTTLPEYNEVLRSATFLAPLVFMFHAKGPIKVLAEYFSSSYWPATFMGDHAFLSKDTFPSKMINEYCRGDINVCMNPLLLFATGGLDMPDPEMIENVLGHVPAGGSTKTIMHYCQLKKSGQFQKFDYGPKLNFKNYGSLVVPTYDLNHVSVPIILISSPNDWLSDIHDVVTLLSQLRNPVIHHVVRRDDFSHTDFVWADDAADLIYYFLIDILEQDLLEKDMVTIK